jgi:hypothetical protein
MRPLYNSSLGDESDIRPGWQGLSGTSQKDLIWNQCVTHLWNDGPNAEAPEVLKHCV